MNHFRPSSSISEATFLTQSNHAEPGPDAGRVTVTRRRLLQTGIASAALGFYSRSLPGAIYSHAETAAEAMSVSRPCLSPSRTSYPPLLQPFIDKIDPSADVFPTEIYALELMRALDEWGIALRDTAKQASGLEKLVADRILFTPLTPRTVTKLHESASLRLQRFEFGEPKSGTRQAFLQEWAHALVTFTRIETADFEIFGIRVAAETPLRVESDIHYDVVGEAEVNTREQRTGSWTVTWARSAKGAWVAEQWVQHTETRAFLAGPGFQEITTAVLPPDSDAAKQLASGIDHYRTVLDAACGIDVYGNHGISVGDIDGSGFDSIYVAQPSGLPNRLLRNRGGIFEDITAASGTGILDGTASAIFADFQNRGVQDLLVVRSGGPLLFHNLGDGRFEPRPEAFRFARSPQGTFTSAAVADYDRDGRLDVYFCIYSYYQGLDHYQFPSPYYDAQNSPPNYLFHNSGDGSFEDMTVSSGMDMNNNRFSFAAEWCDYDGDGWPDLYVANDFGRKNLYRNARNGTFTDVAPQFKVEDYGPGMSTCWMDYDNDGKQDLYVANMWLPEGKRITANDRFLPGVPESIREIYQKHNAGNSMYHNSGGNFEDKSDAAGTERGGWSWSCGSWDINGDGWTDLYVTNGFVSGPNTYDLQSFFWRQVAQRSMEDAGASTDYEMAWNAVNELTRSDYSWSGYQRNSLYINNKDGTFIEAGGVLGLDYRDDSRAFALSDFDGDGRLEFALKNRTAPQLRILRNNLEHQGAALAVRLRGTVSNRDAIGAVVVVEVGGNTQTKQLSAGSGFASQHTKELFFGLGKAEGDVTVTVRWPSGKTELFGAVAANRRILLTEGSGKVEASAFASIGTAAPRKASLALTEPPEVTMQRTWLAAPLLGPDLNLVDSNGSARRLSNLRGKVVALTFLEFSCGESKRQLELFQQGHTLLRAASVEVFAVALQHEGSVTAEISTGDLTVLAATRQQIAAWNIQYRYMFDRRRDLTFPTIMLLDREGATACIYRGLVDLKVLIADSKALPTTAQERLVRATPYAGPYFGNPIRRDYFTAAVAFVEYGMLDEAENALKEAVRQDPQYAAAWFNLGTVYMNKKRFTDAQTALREAVRLNPKDAEAWNNLGTIAGESGNYDEALTCFRYSARANPNYLTAVQNMMQIYQYQARPADAQKALEELLVQAPGNPDLHLGLAMALLGQNDASAAQRELKTAIRLRPGFAEAINNLGTLLMQTGDTEGALREFERCRQIAPDFDRPVLNESLIYNRENKPEKGRALLRQFLARHPDNTDVQGMLQKLGGGS